MSTCTDDFAFCSSEAPGTVVGGSPAGFMFPTLPPIANAAAA